MMFGSQFKDGWIELKESRNTYTISVGPTGKCICKVDLEEIGCEGDRRTEIFQDSEFGVIYYSSISRA
jgi:hypothetical protein